MHAHLFVGILFVGYVHFQKKVKVKVKVKVQKVKVKVKVKILTFRLNPVLKLGLGPSRRIAEIRPSEGP